MNDMSSVLIEKDVDCLYNLYQIPRDLFRVYAPNSNVCVDDQIPAEDTIMIYKEQLKASLRFPISPFFTKVLRFHKLVVT